MINNKRNVLVLCAAMALCLNAYATNNNSNPCGNNGNSCDTGGTTTVNNSPVVNNNPTINNNPIVTGGTGIGGGGGDANAIAGAKSAAEAKAAAAAIAAQAQKQQQEQDQKQNQLAVGTGGKSISGGNKIATSTVVQVQGDAASIAPVIAGNIPAVPTSCRLYLFGGATNKDGAGSGTFPIGNDRTCLTGNKINWMARVNQMFPGTFSAESFVIAACDIEGSESISECKAVNSKQQ